MSYERYKRRKSKGLQITEMSRCGFAFVVASIACVVTAELTQVLPSGNNSNGKVIVNNISYNNINTESVKSCQPDKLTVYKVIFHTFWTRDKFPKHYPDWRPPAQWSKLIGRSHDSTFELFRLGKKASKGLKTFAETGKTDVLEEHGQGHNGLYDEFTASAIPSGSGRTEAEFFVDGNHSRVSVMSRIVPSPDWFVGVDGFDLCVDGNWVDSITVDADPLDAGTDNGFTFTAPNWPTEPQGVVYKVTSRYPSHPAGSFYYPYMKKLPAIATFQFVKMKEYELSEVFHHSEDRDHFELVEVDSTSQNNISDRRKNTDIEEEIEEEREEEEIRNFKTVHSKPGRPRVKAAMAAAAAAVAAAAAEEKVERMAATTATPVVDATSASSGLAGRESELSFNILPNEILQQKRKSKKYKIYRWPRECQVSDWSEWEACSKTCGIGEMKRRRKVLKHARKGGKSCPPLLETKWCGSARSCPKKYFKW